MNHRLTSFLGICCLLASSPLHAQISIITESDFVDFQPLDFLDFPHGPISSTDPLFAAMGIASFDAVGQFNFGGEEYNNSPFAQAIWADSPQGVRVVSINEGHPGRTLPRVSSYDIRFTNDITRVGLFMVDVWQPIDFIFYNDDVEVGRAENRTGWTAWQLFGSNVPFDRVLVDGADIDGYGIAQVVLDGSQIPIGNPDQDGDGVPDGVDNCPAVANADQLDSDLDSSGDACDGCPFDPTDDRSDYDGVCDDVDNCVGTPNPSQSDLDGDGGGDACDACPLDPRNDEDADGVCGDVDNCPTAANADQANTDGDANGDACDPCPNDPTDDASDGDGVCDDVDNCVGTANPDQTDSDEDGAGDACDVCPNDPTDDASDQDGVCDDVDNCLGFCNPDQADGDGDGRGDVCDPCPLDPDDDEDGDGICGDADLCPGTVIPEVNVPCERLGRNRWALVDGDTVFDTNRPPSCDRERSSSGSSAAVCERSFDLVDTMGCSCEQILAARPRSGSASSTATDATGSWGTATSTAAQCKTGHEKFGCSNSVMERWVLYATPPGGIDINSIYLEFEPTGLCTAEERAGTCCGGPRGALGDALIRGR